jgi:polar amino acid transport system substrate-binding protein
VFQHRRSIVKFLALAATIAAIAILVVVVPLPFTANLRANVSQAWLDLGSQGVEVEILQNHLQQQGYLEGEVDGIYGTQTKQAVRQLQRQAGIGADGIVGPQTQTVLSQRIAPQRQNSTAAVVASEFATDAEDTAWMSPDMQRILTRGTLRIAMLGRDNPPFFVAVQSGSMEDEQLVGLDVKIAQALAQELEVEVEFDRSATTFDEVVDLVYRGNADLAISKLSQTLKRARKVRFSEPYLTMRQGLLVNRLQLAKVANGRQPAVAIRELSKRIGVIQDSSYVNFTKEKFPNATAVEYPTWQAAIEAVVKGDVLAAYRDELEVKKVARAQPDAALQLQTVALTDTRDAIAIAVPWQSLQLLAFVNQYLQTVNMNYTADTLLEEYADLVD